MLLLFEEGEEDICVKSRKVKENVGNIWFLRRLLDVCVASRELSLAITSLNMILLWRT